jgi:hypothetical protein
MEGWGASKNTGVLVVAAFIFRYDESCKSSPN